MNKAFNKKKQNRTHLSCVNQREKNVKKKLFFKYKFYVHGDDDDASNIIDSRQTINIFGQQNDQKPI